MQTIIAKDFLANIVLSSINDGRVISKFFSPPTYQQVIKPVISGSLEYGKSIDQRLACSIANAWFELSPENEYVKLAGMSSEEAHELMLKLKEEHIDPEEFDASVLIGLVDALDFKQEMDPNHRPTNPKEELLYGPVSNAINNTDVRDRFLVEYRKCLKAHLREFGTKINSMMVTEFFSFFKYNAGAYSYIFDRAMLEAFKFNVNILSAGNKDSASKPGKAIRQELTRVILIASSEPAYAIDATLLKEPLETILDWVEKEGPSDVVRIAGLYHILLSYITNRPENPLILRHLGIENPSSKRHYRTSRILEMFLDVLTAKNA